MMKDDDPKVGKFANVLGVIVAVWLVLAVLAVLSVAVYAGLYSWLKVLG